MTLGAAQHPALEPEAFLEMSKELGVREKLLQESGLGVIGFVRKWVRVYRASGA